jgi:PTH1 family peptidyl-tRNA hydrolase
VKIIAGLGNPGDQYEWTRHNVGFQVADRLAETYHLNLSRRRFSSHYATGWIDSEKVIVVKPMTFMNRSGEAIQKVLSFFDIGVKDLVVIHDDLDLPFGTFRFKREGGDGGHQGVRSIIGSLGETTFPRLKVGIGRPPRGMDAADYVLQAFGAVERSQLDEILSESVEALSLLLREGVAAAMNRYHKKETKG